MKDNGLCSVQVVNLSHFISNNAMSARFSNHGFPLLLVTCCCVLSSCTFLPISNPSSDKQAVAENVGVDAVEPAGEETATTDPTISTDVNPDNVNAGVDAGVDMEKETPTPAEKTPSPRRDFFREGVNRAQSAVAIGQSAQSPDDWSLAANRWKQAVALMQQVPPSDPDYATAQQKVQEYQKNASQADQQAAGEVSSTRSIATRNNRPDGLVAQIPIIDRVGGTPVVSMTLTGNSGTQQFSILFDTGATLTLITPAMARAVGALVVDEITVTVADGRQVQMPMGYIDTLKVGELVVRDIRVGIGGDVALLGQDVYGQYGISVGGSSINLYE